MNFIARRLNPSHSHRGFSPVIEQVADSASTVLTVYQGGGLKKTVKTVQDSSLDCFHTGLKPRCE
jgi:hypothetical protein